MTAATAKRKARKEAPAETGEKPSRRLYNLWRDANSIYNRAQLLPQDQRAEFAEALREIAAELLETGKE